MKTIRMKKADWEKWGAALRSGEYRQCSDVLADGEGGYCCLGVLEMALDGKIEKTPEAQDSELPSHSWLQSHGIEFDSGEGHTLSAEILGRTPALVFGEKTLLASVANDDYDYDGDGHAYNFAAIADAIQDAVEFTDV